jgi:murein L,D-transpeptidase YcbB/YkuD
MKFQRRHGLPPDGVLGKETLTQLNVAPARRVEQIELSLERLRRLPPLPQSALIAVNIPSFRLWAFADGPADEHAEISMPVIVGRAVRTPTPVFISDMRYVEFNPYWNVPSSISRNEIIPRLERDPGYLEREAMELVGTGTANAPVTRITPQVLQAVRAGTLRIRQRPGPRNALDGIKFVLPNTMDIYLHGTPARQLFGRSRRDFSHGCIRVEDPAALARFILGDQADWPEARIRDAMASGQRSIARLTAGIPVVIFYTTAVANSDGEVFFLADIYGHDATLRRALGRTVR